MSTQSNNHSLTRKKTVRRRVGWIIMGIADFLLICVVVFLFNYQPPAFPLAGVWQEAGGEGRISFAVVCGMEDTCGAVTAPCESTLTLLGWENNQYEFQIEEEETGSCVTGIIFLQIISNDTLHYTIDATYQGETGVSSGAFNLVETSSQAPRRLAALWAALRTWLLNPGVEPLPPVTANLTPTPETGAEDELQEIRNFADPILASIAAAPPTYQDDFTNPASGWPSEFLSAGNEAGYEYGLYTISNWRANLPNEESCYGADLPTSAWYSDFVLETYGKFSNQGNGAWIIRFRDDTTAHYAINISPQGWLWFHKNVSGNHVPLPLTETAIPSFLQGDEFNRITLIAKDNWMAVYVNSEPVAMLDDTSSSRGTIGLGVCDGDPLQVKINGLKIWDISDSNDSRIAVFADPILASTQNSYAGQVQIVVSGTGVASCMDDSDAFYVFTKGGTPIAPIHDPLGYFGLWINNQQALDWIVGGQLPPYQPDHTYTFQINAPGGLLTFGVGDDGLEDNSGSFHITITPLP